MARRETGRSSQAQEDHCSTKPATEGAAKTDAIADTADSYKRTGRWITQSARFSGADAWPETDTARPGETDSESRRKSAGGQSYSGWFAAGTDCCKEVRSSESRWCETERQPRRVAGSDGRQADAANYNWAITYCSIGSQTRWHARRVSGGQTSWYANGTWVATVTNRSKAVRARNCSARIAGRQNYAA